MLTEPTPRFEGVIDLPDVKLYVRQYGTTGPNLLVIHGGPDWDHSYLLPFILPLAQTCRITLFDMRGCGRSEQFNDPTFYTLAYLIQDVQQLIEKLGLSPVILLGVGFGGGIAMRYTMHHRKDVARLILASTSAYNDYQAALNNWDEYKLRYDDDLRHTFRRIYSISSLSHVERVRRMAEAALKLNVYNPAHLPRAAKAINKIRFSGEWLIAVIAQTFDPNDTIDNLYELQMLDIPILILHGEKDMHYPVSVAKRLANTLAGSVLIVLPGTGHLAHIENPTMWNQAVLDFIGNQEKDTADDV